MPYAASEGARIHFRVEGTGPPLVLLHGFGVSGDAWRTGGHVEALSDRFQVITMDARGHGRSDKPHDLAAYSLPKRVRDVTSVLDAVGVKSACILGYSLGGITAYGVSTYAPQRIRSAIVLGAHPYTDRLPVDFEEWGQRYIDCGAKVAIERREAESGPLSHEQKGELEARDWKALGAALVATSRVQGLSEGISQGRIPYMLLCGTRDEDHDLARQASVEFPNVSFRSLEGLDHHESRSRLDILIPIVKDFFGSGLNDAITRTE
ncbi:MAG: alpha/beta fold hydrolase [Dehalococcoidia bacterium]|nr:alpha/beta fold hydrolase [Chloroflexota bacterium]MYB49544.1 alpha/beta fold hydrolase [Dehalococcoidia bacterium]